MNNDLIVRFRIKYHSNSSLEKKQKKNIKDETITMRVYYNSMRMEFSTGYRIDPLRWDDREQCVTGPSRDGTSVSEINQGLMRYKKTAFEIVTIFEERQLIPTQEDFKRLFKTMRHQAQEIEVTIPVKGIQKEKIAPLEIADISCSKPRRNAAKTIFNKKAKK